MEIKYYKVCRVQCKLCGDVLEHANETKQERSSAIVCMCNKVTLDPSALFYRVVGDPNHYEDLSEEWKN